jgi:serine/threonine protein kinase
MFESIETREIGPYVVHELVGWGGMSRVYRATDTSRGDAEVAIKVLSDSIVNDQEYQQRFLREIDIASLLDHPHILPVLDFGGDIGKSHSLLFMVMPLVRAGTLSERLRPGGPLSARETAMLAEQIGSALDYAHSFSIVHRDIKPGNIMVMDENVYCLADFGLVKHVAELAEITSGDILGSPMYMSPEQARGEALDHRTDLYSLGLVLYECLTGRLPYNPRSLVETLGHHVTAPPITPHQISESFPAVLEIPLLRAIEKNRDMRFESGREIADALWRAVRELDPGDADRPLVSQEEIIGSKHLVQPPTVRIIAANVSAA